VIGKSSLGLKAANRELTEPRAKAAQAHFFPQGMKVEKSRPKFGRMPTLIEKELETKLKAKG
jgi:hypothetical protein